MRESTNPSAYSPRHRPLVIAHRGASGLAPENTLAAFRLAIAMGADGIELDVNLSSDGTPVVIHDRRLRRTTDHLGWVSELSAADLQQLDAGSWFVRRLALRPRTRRQVEQALNQHNEITGAQPVTPIRFSSEAVPTLDEVLALMTPTKMQRLYVELKGEATTKSEMLAATLSLVRRHRLERRVTLLSFDHPLIARAKSLAPEIRAAVTLPASRPALTSSRAVLKAVESASADEAALHFGLASRRLVAALHERGIAVSVWTANHQLVMRRLIASGVDAIMTNFPNRLLEVLEAGAHK